MLGFLLVLGCKDRAAPAKIEETVQASACEPTSEEQGEAAARFAGDPPRNLLILSIDTLRRDAIGRYGGGDSTLGAPPERSCVREHVRNIGSARCEVALRRSQRPDRGQPERALAAAPAHRPGADDGLAGGIPAPAVERAGAAILGVVIVLLLEADGAGRP